MTRFHLRSDAEMVRSNFDVQLETLLVVLILNVREDSMFVASLQHYLYLNFENTSSLIPVMKVNISALCYNRFCVFESGQTWMLLHLDWFI